MLLLSKNTDIERRRIERLVEENSALVHWLIGKYAKQHLSDHHYDDIAQNGMYALWRAAKKFDADRGFKFCTMATIYITHEVWRSVEDIRRKGFSGTPCDPQVASLSYILSDGGSDPIELGNTFGKEDVQTRINEANEELESLLRFLTPIEKYVINERFINNRTLTDITGDLGVTRERVRQIETNALGKMRRQAHRMRKEI